ncbi:MAG: ORF6N domain-containing protein [Pseudomonadota bacterium]
MTTSPAYGAVATTAAARPRGGRVQKPDVGVARALAQDIIYDVRGQRVILDADVAAFFGRETSAINQQRSRNADRFPEAYAFQLKKAEWARLRSQTVMSSSHGGRRSPPWAYTEHGFTMLVTRLRGRRAAELSKIIVDTFVSYRSGSLPPDRIITGADAAARRNRLRATLYDQMEALAQFELPTGATVSSEVQTVTRSAIESIKALAQSPAQKHAHMTAVIRKLEAETAQVLATIRKTDAETANLVADALLKRLEAIARVREMAAQLDRDEVAEALDVFEGARRDATPHTQLSGPRT